MRKECGRAEATRFKSCAARVGRARVAWDAVEAKMTARGHGLSLRRCVGTVRNLISRNPKVLTW